MKKTFLAVAVILVLFFAFFIYRYRQATRIPENTAEATLKSGKNSGKEQIVFLGDSITHGRVSYDYVAALSRSKTLSNYTLVNDGINGSLTDQVLQKLKFTLALKPKFVFILVGTNDLKASLSKEEFNYYRNLWSMKEMPSLNTYRKNLNKIISDLKTETRAKIFLISIPILGENPASPPFQKSQAYAKIIKDLAGLHKIGYIPFNETLVRKIEEAHRAAPAPYSLDSGEIFKAIAKRDLAFSSWNSISDEAGRLFLTDNIHLNSRAGKILEALIQEALVQSLNSSPQN